MKKTLITILTVLGMACSAFGQGVVEPKNITYTGTNTFLGMLIGNGTNLTGIVKTNEMGSGAIWTGSNWVFAGLGASYLSSSTGVVVDALAYNKYIMNLSTNLVMQAPTNAIAGRSLQWSITAVGANRTVTWPTNIFKIPSSSTMSNVVTIVSNTESIFVIEYRTNTPQWKLETYVWGY